MNQLDKRLVDTGTKQSHHFHWAGCKVKVAWTPGGISKSAVQDTSCLGLSHRLPLHKSIAFHRANGAIAIFVCVRLVQ